MLIYQRGPVHHAINHLTLIFWDLYRKVEHIETESSLELRMQAIKCVVVGDG